VRVTEVPTCPPPGEKVLTTGAGPTVKLFALDPIPAAVVTEIVPEVAVPGTTAVIEMSLQRVMLVAAMLLKVAELVP
jgi:hypothetical protein